MVMERHFVFRERLRKRQADHSTSRTAVPSQPIVSHGLRLVPAASLFGLSVSHPNRSEERPIIDPVTATLSPVTNRRIIFSYILDYELL
jgi:hypothetical protein